MILRSNEMPFTVPELFRQLGGPRSFFGLLHHLAHSAQRSFSVVQHHVVASKLQEICMMAQNPSTLRLLRSPQITSIALLSIGGTLVYPPPSTLGACGRGPSGIDLPANRLASYRRCEDRPHP